MTENSDDADEGTPRNTVDEEGDPPNAFSEPDTPGITDYTVGYRKPPMEMRFKDQSGNPRGRPRGSKNHKTIMREIANELHTVTEDGKPRRLSTLEIMLLAFRNHAAKGDVRALRAIEKYMTKFGPQTGNSQAAYMIAPAEMTPEEWIAEQEEKNKTRKPPAGYE